MTRILSVSLDDSMYNLMKKLAISPSKAIRVGIRAIAHEPFQDERGISITETQKTQLAKLQRANEAMQEQILKLSNDLENTQKGN